MRGMTTEAMRASGATGAAGWAAGGHHQWDRWAERWIVGGGARRAIRGVRWTDTGTARQRDAQRDGKATGRRQGPGAAAHLGRALESRVSGLRCRKRGRQVSRGTDRL